MGKNTGTNKENLEKTRKIFLKIGREEFVKNGFANTSTNAIVENAGMARGSLYYHFGDKEGLFRAVFSELLLEMHTNVLEAIKMHDDALERFKAGCRAYFEVCARDDFRKILLIEGLTTIPYHDRLELIGNNLMGTLKELIEDCYTKQKFNKYDPQILMIFLYGLLSEAGRSFEHAKDHDDFLKRTSATIETLLDELAE